MKQEMPKRSISLTLNGKPLTAEIDDDITLLHFLRKDLRLTGTKEGCGQAECGACTVLVNNKAVNSCLIPAAAVEGCEVVTIEGLERDHEMDTLQKSFIDEGAIQCGFCTPGVIMSAKALLLANPCPSEREIRESLAGNLCRCTGYEKIVRAVMVASGQEQQVSVPESKEYAVIGHKARRRDTIDKATGKAEYADDLTFPNMVYGKALRSACPHALIRGIDCDEARRVPGVLAVLTSKDIPGLNRYGVAIADQPVLADDKVRCYGDAVALVVAENEEIAEAAAKLIRVDYEELPGIFSPEDGLKPGAPRIHEKGNLLQHTTVRKGDAVAAFERCDVIVEGTYQTQLIEHAYMEPECSVASVDHQGSLTVWTSTQYVFRDRRQIAKVFGMPINKVRVVQMTTGGGFGGKDDITAENLAVLAAIKTGRPAKVRFTREESMRATTKRHPMLIRARLGADSEGKLLALEGTVYGDKGAYCSLGAFVIKKTGLHLGGPYYIPNIKVDTYAVYTNNPPGGAMRGFGVVQAAFAHESLMDLLAERLHIDPWEIRDKNALAPGLSTGTGHVLQHSVGIKQTLAEVKNYLEANPLDCDLTVTEAVEQ
jgi:xanthine dehydrogenase molybdopterin-binding subunit B